MSICVEVWGEYACFSRPELKVERVSYDVITPSAARGLIESIYFHPGLRWFVDKIYVRAPIQFFNVRRNEVSAKLSASNALSAMKSNKPFYLATTQNIQQRATMALRNVRYIICAHFEMTDKAAPGDNPGKFQDIVTRRISKGQCYSQPYFGNREFAAHFAPCEEIPPCPESLLGVRDLGWMLYDKDYSDLEDITPRFFRCSMKDGLIDLTNVEVAR
ncbi:MAG: type I-C CRISPR-associated protein Cas5c [Oscillospiraceae bacterium]|nr:type I-C CRISPR-associated protein Cas5c [Oscillospiraceae bacterium]